MDCFHGTIEGDIDSRGLNLGVETSNDMTKATVKKLLSIYPSIRSFSISGQGEPTLCLGFVDIVDFLKQEGKNVGVITNGTNPEKLLSLTCQPDYTSISLYGMITRAT